MHEIVPFSSINVRLSSLVGVRARYRLSERLFDVILSARNNSLLYLDQSSSSLFVFVWQHLSNLSLSSRQCSVCLPHWHTYYSVFTRLDVVNL